MDEDADCGSGGAFIVSAVEEQPLSSVAGPAGASMLVLIGDSCPFSGCLAVIEVDVELESTVALELAMGSPWVDRYGSTHGGDRGGCMER